MTYQINITCQNVILARLGDFCQWGGIQARSTDNPWDYMLAKLSELEEPISHLKQDQLMVAGEAFLERLKQKQLEEIDIVEFKTIIHDYLSPNDFIDIAFNLTPQALSNPAQQKTMVDMIRNMKALSLFKEKNTPMTRLPAPARKLLEELQQRLWLDTLDKILARKPRTPRRRRMVLRRIRRNVAEYCTVLHVPLNSNDTFSPFMLLRVEALLLICYRLLDKYREEAPSRAY